MTDTTEQTPDSTLLTLLRSNQQSLIVALRSWADKANSVTGKLPYADKIPSVSSVKLPFAGKLPTAEQAVQRYYDLAEQMLARQRKFAEELLVRTTPKAAVDAEPAADESVADAS